MLDAEPSDPFGLCQGLAVVEPRRPRIGVPGVLAQVFDVRPGIATLGDAAGPTIPVPHVIGNSGGTSNFPPPCGKGAAPERCSTAPTQTGRGLLRDRARLFVDLPVIRFAECINTQPRSTRTRSRPGKSLLQRLGLHSPPTDPKRSLTGACTIA